MALREIPKRLRNGILKTLINAIPTKEVIRVDPNYPEEDHPASSQAVARPPILSQEDLVELTFNMIDISEVYILSSPGKPMNFIYQTPFSVPITPQEMAMSGVNQVSIRPAHIARAPAKKRVINVPPTTRQLRSSCQGLLMHEELPNFTVRSCPKCKGHGTFVIYNPIHKSVCPHTQCDCKKCIQVDKRRARCSRARLNKKIIKSDLGE